MGDIVYSVSFCPNPSVSILAVCVQKKLLLLNTAIGSKALKSATQAALAISHNAGREARKEEGSGAKKDTFVEWQAITAPPSSSQPSSLEVGEGKEEDEITGLEVIHRGPVKQVEWHRKGDYVAVVVETPTNQVAVHRISVQKTQSPFKKMKVN